MRETSFYYFLSAADLEACVQLLPPLKEKKKIRGERLRFFREGAPSICYTLKQTKSHSKY